MWRLNSNTDPRQTHCKAFTRISDTSVRFYDRSTSLLCTVTFDFTQATGSKMQCGKEPALPVRIEHSPQRDRLFAFISLDPSKEPDAEPTSLTDVRVFSVCPVPESAVLGQWKMTSTDDSDDEPALIERVPYIGKEMELELIKPEAVQHAFGYFSLRIDTTVYNERLDWGDSSNDTSTTVFSTRTDIATGEETPFLFKQRPDGTMLITYRKDRTTAGLTLAEGSPDQVYELHYRVTRFNNLEGRFTYGSRIIVPTDGVSPAKPLVEINRKLEATGDRPWQWKYTYVDGAGLARTCVEWLTDPLRARGLQECTTTVDGESKLVETRAFVVTPNSDGSFTFLLRRQPLTPEEVAAGVGYPSLRATVGTESNIRYYMYPVNMIRDLIGSFARTRSPTDVAQGKSGQNDDDDDTYTVKQGMQCTASTAIAFNTVTFVSNVNGDSLPLASLVLAHDSEGVYSDANGVEYYTYVQKLHGQTGKRQAIALYINKCSTGDKSCRGDETPDPATWDPSAYVKETWVPCNRNTLDLHVSNNYLDEDGVYFVAAPQSADGARAYIDDARGVRVQDTFDLDKGHILSKESSPDQGEAVVAPTKAYDVLINGDVVYVSSEQDSRLAAEQDHMLTHKRLTVINDYFMMQAIVSGEYYDPSLRQPLTMRPRSMYSAALEPSYHPETPEKDRSDNCVYHFLTATMAGMYECRDKTGVVISSTPFLYALDRPSYNIYFVFGREDAILGELTFMDIGPEQGRHASLVSAYRSGGVSVPFATLTRSFRVARTMGYMSSAQARASVYSKSATFSPCQAYSLVHAAESEDRVLTTQLFERAQEEESERITIAFGPRGIGSVKQGEEAPVRNFFDISPSGLVVLNHDVSGKFRIAAEAYPSSAQSNLDVYVPCESSPLQMSGAWTLTRRDWFMDPVVTQVRCDTAASIITAGDVEVTCTVPEPGQSFRLIVNHEKMTAVHHVIGTIEERTGTWVKLPNGNVRVLLSYANSEHTRPNNLDNAPRVLDFTPAMGSNNDFKSVALGFWIPSNEKDVKKCQLYKVTQDTPTFVRRQRVLSEAQVYEDVLYKTSNRGYYRVRSASVHEDLLPTLPWSTLVHNLNVPGTKGHAKFARNVANVDVDAGFPFGFVDSMYVPEGSNAQVELVDYTPCVQRLEGVFTVSLNEAEAGKEYSTQYITDRFADGLAAHLNLPRHHVNVEYLPAHLTSRLAASSPSFASKLRVDPANVRIRFEARNRFNSTSWSAENVGPSLVRADAVTGFTIKVDGAAFVIDNDLVPEGGGGNGPDPVPGKGKSDPLDVVMIVCIAVGGALALLIGAWAVRRCYNNRKMRKEALINLEAGFEEDYQRVNG